MTLIDLENVAERLLYPYGYEKEKIVVMPDKLLFNFYYRNERKGLNLLLRLNDHTGEITLGSFYTNRFLKTQFI